jgi:uncharacterized protein YlxW (UPF0749 family)
MAALSRRIRTIPGWQIALALALAALGFLITAQLRSEAPRVRYTSQERSPLIETALSLQAQQDELKARILALRAQIEDLEQQGEGSATLVARVNEALESTRTAAGLRALRGTGVVLQLQDSAAPPQPGDNVGDYLVTARDLRTTVEQLWLSGAEAVSINGERIVSATAILDIGGTILVNSAYLAPPYQVSAIGPEGLYERLSDRTEFRAFVRDRAEAFGIQMSFAELEDVAIPAYAGIVNLRAARPVPSASPGPSIGVASAPPGASPGATGSPATPGSSEPPGSAQSPGSPGGTAP